MTAGGIAYARSVGDAVPLPNGRVLLVNGNKVRSVLKQ